MRSRCDVRYCPVAVSSASCQSKVFGFRLLLPELSYTKLQGPLLTATGLYLLSLPKSQAGHVLSSLYQLVTSVSLILSINKRRVVFVVAVAYICILGGLYRESSGFEVTLSHLLAIGEAERFPPMCEKLRLGASSPSLSRSAPTGPALMMGLGTTPLGPSWPSAAHGLTCCLSSLVSEVSEILNEVYL